MAFGLQTASASFGGIPVLVLPLSAADSDNTSVSTPFMNPVAIHRASAQDIEIFDGLTHDVRSAAAAARGVETGGRGTEDEAYTLQAGSNGCVVRAGGPRGALWGLRTLAQLVCQGGLANISAAGEGEEDPLADVEGVSVTVEDWPEYGWRGCMLDCARHWMPVDYMIQMVEILSRFKMNVLHWHLSDDQVST
jgi:N-acetyl-beta-hexosaminidase